MTYLGKGLLALVIVVSAIMVFPAATAMPVGGGLAMAGGSASHGSPSSAAAPSSAPAAPSAPTGSSALESQVLATLKADNAPMNKVFLPNFDADVTAANGVISPLYSVAPAPMGLGDFGIQEKNGKNVGTISYTDSVKASLTLNAVDPLYIGAAGPDQFTIQANTVGTNVDVLGSTANQYWLQNVPVYYASSHTLVFEDNIWNFSNPNFYFPPNGIYAHGPASFFIGDEVYIGIGTVAYDVAPPFTITTYNNVTVYNDRPTVFFNYTLSKSGVSVSGSYDFAEFNSTGLATPTGPAPSPDQQINGKAVNPTGFLINDAEIMLGGPGGGSETNLMNIAGSFGLWTQPNGTSVYKDVPAAFDFGTDTGETSAGIAEWSSGGANPVADIASGPSLLYPLWGVAGSVPSGAVHQTVNVNPSNAFIFVSPGTKFDKNTAAWAPVPTSGMASYWLPPGKYTYQILLSDRKPVTMTLSGAASRTVNLAPDTALGVYTPLWASSNAQLAGISQSGAGTFANPYVLYNNQVGLLSPLFAEWNDYLFPVFPGILIVDTTAYVSIVNAPSFELAITIQPEEANVVQFGLPTTNYLEIGFLNVTHVSLVNSPLITGWIFADDVGFTEASVVFWYSSDNLIAGNTFQVMSDGLMIYGGTHNTIWGNVFVPIAAPAADPGAVGLYGAQIAMILWSSGNLIYNNAFVTPTTAVTPTVDIYSGASVVYTDRWNVSVQPSTDVRTVNGWSLTGSILGLSWEGGNYWANYGSPSDPYGVLPYNNSGAITVGGDDHPLVSVTLYKVVYTEKGLPSGKLWSVTLGGVTLWSTTTTITFYDPNGVYAFTVGAVKGHTAKPTIGAVDVSGHNVYRLITWS
ncbi:MAG: thermopsin family protease [Thermoplasmata archaeon]